jgi:hypothetical protein
LSLRLLLALLLGLFLLGVGDDEREKRRSTGNILVTT